MFAQSPGLPRRVRLAIAAAIVLIHVGLALVLVRAFGGVRALAESVGLAPALVAIPLPDPPKPPTQAGQSRVAQGASGAAGARASADQIVAAPPRIVLPAFVAAPVAGLGSETRSGASDSGAGTGGAATGTGTGSGGAGNGAGGAKTKPVKTAGDLAESDYPAAGRAKRLGTSVIVVLTVGTDGRVTACRVHQPSGDPEADAITCRLAQDRFRFKPALDQNGDPIEASYGWQQSFFWK